MKRLLGVLLLGWCAATGAGEVEQDWSRAQVEKLPKSETAVYLFNGKDTTGWEGQEKYWSVREGIIVGKNSAENAPPASTYLVTQKKYRNFRLIFEGKLETSEMHTGISLWGKSVEKMGDAYSYQGHLVMFPSGYGFYDLYRRNSIYRDAQGVARKAGKQHEWNRMEILAIGSRIRHVVNGQLVADWTDPMPELCEAGPIGLQLHSNTVPQEVQFRGLVLTENPEDALVTVDAPAPRQTGLDQIAPRMERFVQASQISGAVTLVAKNGQVVHLEAVGLADLESKQPMTKDSVFAIASMTKPITATAVMILRDQGKLSIDDPVSKYIPEFKNAKLADGSAPARELTIKDVLTHTSGLQGDQRNEGTLEQTAKKLAARPLAFQPGAKWQYSPGLTVAGRVVEVASGMSFEEFLDKHIFAPLGMKDTTFHPNRTQLGRIVKLYQPGPGTPPNPPLQATTHWINEVTPDRTANPSGGLFSTAADLAKFYQMLLDGGTKGNARIITEKSIKEMTTLQTGDLVTGFTPGHGWGLGWCVVREPQGVTGPLSAGTFGHGGAFGTQGWVDPQTKTIYVLLIQRTNFGNSDGSDIRGEFHRLANGK